MSKKDDIVEELLDSVNDPAELERIFRRNRSSRGPFYFALAEATSQLDEGFRIAAREATAAAGQKQHLQEELDSLAGQKRELEQVQVELDEVHGLLDQAKALTQWGFGQEELNRLYDLLAQVAASQGAPPEEGVAQFFETAERYKQIISFDLEAKRAESRAAQAKAEAERWEAEADAKSVQSQARISVIDLVEELLAKGIKGDDFLSWAAIVEKAGVSIEELAESLEEYSAVQALSADRQRQAEEIQTEITGLKSQVLALAQERDGAHQAIIAVKDKTLKQVRAAERQARQHVDSLLRDATNYGHLKKEAEELGEWIRAAQLLRAGPESWKQLPREVVQHLLMVALRRAEVEGRDPLMSPPDTLRRNGRLPSWARLSLSEVLLWALTGLITEEERRARS